MILGFIVIGAIVGGGVYLGLNRIADAIMYLAATIDDVGHHDTEI